MSLVSSLFRWLRAGQAGSVRPPADDQAFEGEPDPVDLSGSDTIDLHTFRPKDIRSAVAEFLEAASARGHRHVRIIHGKGTGLQRKIVGAILQDHPLVVSYRTAPDASGWGATVAELRRPAAGRAEDPDEG